MHVKSAVKPMALWKHAIAYVTLGLLCGWYYFILLLYPILLIFAARGSYLAGTIFLAFITLSLVPIKHEAWEGFMYCWIWDIWREYFGMTMDIESIKGNKLKKGKRYMFFEFPHGIFPMGQFLSASLIREITPGTLVCGTGADIVFMFPVMRQIMAWIGTQTAKRSSFTKIFNAGHYAAVIPGGIAEMYLVNSKTENIYLRKRHNTVKVAIQEGANIIPAFFFGNTRLFHVADKAESDSFFAKLSRKLRASVVFFYGRHYLPVPFRQHIHMVSADIVEVTQNDNPTEEEIQAVLQKVIESVEKVYKEKRPEWETRPLVIT